MITNVTSYREGKSREERRRVYETIQLMFFSMDVCGLE